MLFSAFESLNYFWSPPPLQSINIFNFNFLCLLCNLFDNKRSETRFCVCSTKQFICVNVQIIYIYHPLNFKCQCFYTTCYAKYFILLLAPCNASIIGKNDGICFSVHVTVVFAFHSCTIDVILIHFPV